MGMRQKAADDRPSLENLIERYDFGIEILHPGGLEITKELATMCHLREDSRILEVASGTGESACFLAKEFGATVTGVDISEHMIRRAESKCKGQNVRFTKADANDLPFTDNSFDMVISECTLSLLNKKKVLGEMCRVLKSRGYVGFHDLYWKENAPTKLREELALIEDERPETVEGWKRLLRSVGMEEVRSVDKSGLMPEWMRDSRKRLGFIGYLKAAAYVLRCWGIRGMVTVLRSERIFSSKYLGYCIVVGRKP